MTFNGVNIFAQQIEFGLVLVLAVAFEVRFCKTVRYKVYYGPRVER